MHYTVNKAGVTLALSSAVAFALANTVVGVAYRGGTNPLTVSATRFVLPMVALLLILWLAKKPVLLPARAGIGALILGVVTSAYTLALLSSLSVLPVGIAILVFYLFPIITAFIVSIFRWAPLSRWTIIGALIGFCGLALALGVKFEDYPLIGILQAAFAALGLATVSAVSGRVIGTGDPRQATLYMATGALVSFMVIVAIVGGFALPETGEGWVGLGITNLLYAFAMIGYFYAISYIGAAFTTIFSNLEPLVAIVAAFFLLDQQLEPLQLIGAAIVVAALFVAARGKPPGTGH
ncbi:MAG: DMT family transporter [Proteobacteria bacterium]|nr:DMT family transporter [Pseudomonadota bacterium]